MATKKPQKVRPPREITMKGMRILRAFLDAIAANPEAELYGLDIMKSAHILSGTLYPLLMKFEREGLLTSRWEKIDPKAEGRAARRLYRITALGVQVAHAALADVVPGWAHGGPVGETHQ